MNFLRLFTTCILIKGVLRYIIVDTDEHEIHFFKSCNDFLDKLSKGSVPIFNLKKEQKKILDYIIQNKLGFIADAKAIKNYEKPLYNPYKSVWKEKYVDSTTNIRYFKRKKS